MSLLDFLGITKKVNETDIIRKKEEIDSLYNEMVKIADKLTETVTKIKDLKEKLESASSEAKPEAEPEADADIKNKSEVSNNNETKPEETGDKDAEVNEDLVSDETADAPAVDAVTQPAVVQTTPSTEQPLFGTGTLPSYAVGVNPVNATNNAAPLIPGTMAGQIPQTQQQQTQQLQPQQTQPHPQPQPQQPLGLQMQDNLKSSDLFGSDGGKNKRKTKSANAPKRKRRTRRNKKALAADAAASSTEAST